MIRVKDIENLYWKQRLSLREIEKRIGLSDTAIYHLMKREGIPIRSKKEACGKQPNFSDKETLSYVVGVVMGDGSVRSGRGKVSLIQARKKFAMSFELAMRKLGVNTYTRMRWRRDRNPNWSDLIEVWACSAKLARWIRNLSLEEFGAVVKSDGGCACEFVRGMFESDGTNIFSTHRWCVEIVGKKRELLYLTYDLIQRFIPYSKFKIFKDKNECYRIRSLDRVTNERFIRLVNPCIKNEKLSDYFEASIKEACRGLGLSTRAEKRAMELINSNLYIWKGKMVKVLVASAIYFANNGTDEERSQEKVARVLGCSTRPFPGILRQLCEKYGGRDKGDATTEHHYFAKWGIIQ